MNDLFSIEGKVALVTGGGSGIGWMIAEGYARAGAKVYIASRKQAELDARIEELAGEGDVTAIVADLSTDEGCRGLGDEIEARESGRLDILVNNAGANWGEDYETFPEAAWDRVLNVNVKGVFQLTRRLTDCLAAAASEEASSAVRSRLSESSQDAPPTPIAAYGSMKEATPTAPGGSIEEAPPLPCELVVLLLCGPLLPHLEFGHRLVDVFSCLPEFFNALLFLLFCFPQLFLQRFS